MATSFELADSVTIKGDGTNGGDVVTSGAKTTIYRSPEQSNNNDLENLRVVVEYETVPTTSGSGFGLKALVETKGNSATRWIPMVEQNNAIQEVTANTQNVKVFEINPQIFDQTFGGTLDQGNTSYQFKQDKPSDKWRVCIHLTDGMFGTADAFTEAVVSIHGDTS